MPAFSVVISEKGGAERREAFEQPELSIGRVQGNDLMLPKGNVSKRHARLVYREGRFIVTDLNSTNGTYVNRRRINQATIVRQGDRIYIGDFVLRIELADDEGSGASQRPSAMSMPLRAPLATNPDAFASTPARDSDVSAPHYPPVPPAPRVPTSTGSDSSPSASPSSGPRASADKPPVTREDSVSSEAVSYRSAVAALADRVAEQVGTALLDGEIDANAASRVDRAIDEQLRELRSEGIIAAVIIDDRLRKDVRAELLELGAVGPLLADDSVTEIAITGLHGIAAVRGGQRVAVEPPLSTDGSLRRVLDRLLRRAVSEVRTEGSVREYMLDSGFRVYALSADGGREELVRIERPQRVDMTMDDLVRSGVVSRAIATFLKHCVTASVNILVVGPRDARTSAILCALSASSPERHALVLSERDLFTSGRVGLTRIDVGRSTEPERLVEFAGQMPGARLVIERFAGRLALSTLEAIGAGAEGVLAAMTGPSIRRALARFPAELAGVRAGLSPDDIRQWLAGSFDIILEVATLRDGRHRVLRVSEPIGVAGDEIQLQDLFTFIVERTATGGSVEGTFHPSGSQSRLLEELTARGLSLDSTLFRVPKV